jgi:phosphatidylglycerol:prolipoprotein diacylglycerol transferase
MLPKLFEIGPITIHSFGFTLALAFLVIAWLAGKEFTRRGFTADDAWSLTLAAMIGGVLGAKLYFVLDNWSDAMADPKGLIFSGSGLTYYGGLFGGALGVILTARRRKLPLDQVAGIGGPLIALGYGLGRVGCFLNGDDYGRPTDLPWGMTFPKGSPPTDVAVHPTQVYETLLSLAVFAFLWSRRKAWEHRGWFTLGLFLVLAGAEPFLVEFVRTNAPVALGLTMAQWISLVVLGLGLFLVVRTRNTVSSSSSLSAAS